MAELPIMPIKTDALIADTCHLSAEEFGAYMRILLTMWRHGGRLPYDLKKLGRVTGCHPLRWAVIRDAVMGPFTIADGFVSQKRLTSTMLEVREIRKKRAVSGALGAATRWRPKLINGGTIVGNSAPYKPLK